LMSQLMAAAKRRGIVRIQGAVLRSNTKMLRFTKALGFAIRDDPADAEQVVVERPLQNIAVQ
jgi:acetyltransferase